MVFIPNGELPTVISLTHTASNDAIFKLTNDKLLFRDLNIHCYTNDALYGAFRVVDAVLTSNAIASFRDGDLSDFQFKNRVAGSNCKIVAVFTLKGV